MPQPPVSDAELIRRAFAAYYRSADPRDPQPSQYSEAVWHKSLHYVVLHNVDGVLAVYRVTNRGDLRRLRRWPKALDAIRSKYSEREAVA